MRTILRLILRILYGFKAYHVSGLDTPGPVLLIPNHVSWLDWLFVYVCLDNDWKFVTSSTTAGTSWLYKPLMINRRTFPSIPPLHAVKRMAEFPNRRAPCPFAEGRSP